MRASHINCCIVITNYIVFFERGNKPMLYHTDTHAQKHTHTHTHTYIHTHARTHMHTHTHILKQLFTKVEVNSVGLPTYDATTQA